MDSKMAIQELVLEKQSKEDELTRKKLYFRAMANRDSTKETFEENAMKDIKEMEKLKIEIEMIHHCIELLQK